MRRLDGRYISSMRCPICGGATDVRDSRGNTEGTQIRRRRYCRVSPSHRFTTVEYLESHLTKEAERGAEKALAVRLRAIARKLDAGELE